MPALRAMPILEGTHRNARQGAALALQGFPSVVGTAHRMQPAVRKVTVVAQTNSRHIPDISWTHGLGSASRHPIVVPGPDKFSADPRQILDNWRRRA